MNDVDTSGQNPQRATSAGAAGHTAGSLLRQYREEREVELSQLAAVLKVRPEKLHALESDQYDQLPGLVFCRSLAMSVCRLLNADAAPVLALLPAVAADANSQLHLERSRAIVKNHSTPFASSSPSLLQGKGSRIALAVAALLVAGTVALYVWPSDEGNPVERTSSTGTRSETIIPPSLPSTAGTRTSPPPVTAPATAPATGDDPILNLVTGLPALSGTTPPTAVADLATAAANAAGTTATAGNATTTETTSNTPAADAPTLRILAKDTVWVQVRGGANRRTVLRQTTLAAGEEVVITQEPPLRVDIGRISAVEVQVNGQPYDLQPHARGTVARFDLAP